MTEIEFISELKDAPFSREKYASIGVSDNFITRTIEGYNPRQKISAQTIFTDDPLIRLVNSYDLTKTEIGMICFDSEVTETENYFYVGKFEVDFLCVSKFSREVVILSFDDPLNVSYKCAQNSSLFLEVMIVAAKFLEKCGLDENLRNNKAAICSMAKGCSEFVGGKTYINFYKVLLGCESPI